MNQYTIKSAINTLLRAVQLLGALAFIVTATLSINTAAYALGPGGFLNNISSTFGHVGAVGIEKDSNGNPIIAEFDSTGSIVGELREFTGRVDLRVMPAQDYNALVTLTNQLKQANPGSSLMSLDQYNSRTFSTITGDPVNQPAVIGRDTRSVLIVDERQLLVAEPPYESVILQEFPVNLSGGDSLLNNNIVTLLIDDNVTGIGRFYQSPQFLFTFLNNLCLFQGP